MNSIMSHLSIWKKNLPDKSYWCSGDILLRLKWAGSKYTPHLEKMNLSNNHMSNQMYSNAQYMATRLDTCSSIVRAYIGASKYLCIHRPSIWDWSVKNWWCHKFYILPFHKNENFCNKISEMKRRQIVDTSLLYSAGQDLHSHVHIHDTPQQISKG